MEHIHSATECDYIVSGIIIHSNKVLLLFHRKLQLWLSLPGYVELDATPIEALYREIKEKAGLTPTHPTPILPLEENLDLAREPDQNFAHSMPKKSAVLLNIP